MVPLVIVAIVVGTVVLGLAVGVRLTSRVEAGDKPPVCQPDMSFVGAVTLGRVFMNLPGTARLEISSEHAVLRPAGCQWFRPVWIDRSSVRAVYAGPWHSGVGGGIRFRSEDDRLERIGFWPTRRGRTTNERDRALAALRGLGWPVDET